MFRGGEFQVQFDVVPVGGGLFGIDGQYDIVRATFTDGTNVPRIPPQRSAAACSGAMPNWFARVGLLHAFAQNDIADERDADRRLQPAQGGGQLHPDAEERTDRPHRVHARAWSATTCSTTTSATHVSFTKDEVLMPGRTVRAFASVEVLTDAVLRVRTHCHG